MTDNPASQKVGLASGIKLAFRSGGDRNRCALVRMEAHILDGGHFLLETHAARAATLIGEFLQKPTGWHH